MMEYFPRMIVGRDRVHLTPRSANRYIEAIYEMFKHVDQASGYSLVDFESPDLTLVPDTARSGRDWNEEEDEDMEESSGTEITPPTDPISPSRTLSMVSLSMLPITLPSMNNRPQRAPAILTGGNATAIRPSFPAITSNSGVRFAVPPPGFATTTTQPPPASAPVPPPTTWPTMLTPELSTSLSRIEQRLGLIEAKSIQDNIMMAVIKEDLDTEANRAMLDRLTIIGIKIQDLGRMKDDERNPLMKSKVEETIKKIVDDDQEFEVVFVRHLNRQSRSTDFTILEVRFKSEKQAADVRSSFIKKRNSAGLENINITPTVRLATRVRIEILQAIGIAMKKEDSSVTKTQCLQFVPKPVLKVFRSDSRGQEYSRVMTFADCIIWTLENDAEKSLGLKKAYDRAGSAFRGLMSQHFVIMA